MLQNWNGVIFYCNFNHLSHIFIFSAGNLTTIFIENTQEFLFWQSVWQSVWRSSFSRDCFEKPILVHSIFSSKFMIKCLNPILVHFSIARISDFGPGSYFESKLEQNRNFELLKMDQNRFWTHDHTFRRENWVDQNRIFEASSSRENELLQTLFCDKKGTIAY